MSENASWLLKPRNLVGLLITVLIVLYLIGVGRNKLQKGGAPATAGSSTATVGAHPSARHVLSQNNLRTLPVIQTLIASKPFKLWLASSKAQQEAGLMHVSFLPADRGMLFTFQPSAKKAFWMKNTPLPLDVIFLASNKVVRIYTMAPMNDTRIYSSGVPVNAAIELNAGTCAKLGLKPGDIITLPVGAS